MSWLVFQTNRAVYRTPPPRSVTALGTSCLALQGRDTANQRELHVEGGPAMMCHK